MILQNAPHARYRKDEVGKIARFFFTGSHDVRIIPLGQGNINDTYLVDIGVGKFVLQRINDLVFPQPHCVAENTARLSTHIQSIRSFENNFPFPFLIPTRDGENYHRDHRGDVWRAQEYIDNSRVYDKPASVEMARQVGMCLARFHVALEELPPDLLHIPLPDFHVPTVYLQKYDKSFLEYGKEITPELQYCCDVVARHRGEATILERGRENGVLVLSVVHGDPKISNILFQKSSDQALTLVDLDTVGPGLILHDIGDCLRSCSCSTGEKSYDPVHPVKCDLEMVAAVLQGYFSEKSLSDGEKDLIYESLCLITFELGLRFLLDYLQGSWYFRISQPEENLHRALLQFQLAASVRNQQQAIRQCVEQAEEIVQKQERK